jgi:polysaccharide export outer membrane protein
MLSSSGKPRVNIRVPAAIGAWTAVLAITQILIGCGGGGTAAPITRPPGEVPTEYVIGPGDTIQVFVWRNPELSTTVPVRPDGRVSTPLVEDMVAVGKTATQLARDIEKVLAEYVRSPSVNVIVTNFVGTFAKQIRVVGRAANPRALAYRENMTVLDVMLEVGGLAEFAAGNRAKIVRQVNGQQTEIRVRLDDLLNDGDIGANVTMLPGDVLIIPESRF